MTALTTLTSLVCAGCGEAARPLAPRPFRCSHANEGDEIDHRLVRHIDLCNGGASELRRAFADAETNPFIRYRKLTHAWHTAAAIGMTDAEFVQCVENLDEHVAAVDGRGFRVTPFERKAPLGAAVGIEGGLWVKDETGNVAGSHKGRHLMGLALWLEVAEEIDRDLLMSPLAIASCGNAALAAAVVARASSRPLEVYIPEQARAATAQHLERLGARVHRCAREKGMTGDPCYRRFREAVAAGALPFTCQGSENGLVVEGGETLGWEIVSELVASRSKIDRLFIQVGGGALASACIAALEEAVALGLLPRLPRIHAVQTEASPLRRAYERVVALATTPDRALQYAVRHRGDFMWPWEREPQSVATGILDDETYDWAAVVRGMLISGGSPIVVSEERLLEANRLAVSLTGIPVDATGSAGLAGAIEARRLGLVAQGDSVAVVFTGRNR